MFRQTISMLGLALAAVSAVGCKGNDVPFTQGQTWTGTYTCPQGPTDLTLRIEKVTDKSVEALFDFSHASSGSKGVYKLAGVYDLATRKIELLPGEWIGEHPPTYVPVGMSGTVSADARQFTGTVTNPKCTTFSVTAAGGS